MFNCANISASQASTYYKLDDYYHEKGHVPARVMGAASARLGLAGEFDSVKFNDALHGKFGGEPIVSANKPSLERAGYDCVFSAPKSVSIEALVYGEKDVVQAHQSAVDAAMHVVQDLVRARVTENFKTDFVAAEVAYFNFRHETSRNIAGELPDPNLHDHNVIIKQVVVRDAAGNEKLYALNNEEIFEAQKMLDAVYKQVLGEKLRALGYQLELTKDGFEISGYSREHIDSFSKRRNEVDANLEAMGLSRDKSSIKQRDAANLKNRNSKKTFSREEMRAGWKAASSDFQRPTRGNNNDKHHTAASARSAETIRGHERIAAGYRPSTPSDVSNVGRKAPPTNRRGVREMSAINVVHNAKGGEVLLQRNVRVHLDDERANPYNAVRRLDGRAGGLTADDAVSVAIHHFKQRQVAIGNRYQLVEFAIKSAEFDFPVQQIQQAVDRAIVDGKLILGRNGKALVIEAAHADEKAIERLYRGGSGAVPGAASYEAAMAGIAKMEASMTFRRITDEEAKLGRPLHANERANLTVKLKDKQVAMVEKIATSGDRFNIIVGDAGTGKSTGMEAAKIVLEAAGYQVKGLAPSGAAVQALAEAGLDTKTVQHAFHNPKYWDDVNDKTVLVLDEAGLVDAETMRFIKESVAERGARLAIVGDPKQYGSVNRGTAMKQLCALAGKDDALVNLDQMQRGRNEFMKGLHFAARDKPEASLDLMFKNQMVTAISDDKDRLSAIASMYVGMDERDKKTALVLTGTNADRIQINDAIRFELGMGEGGKISSLEMIDATVEATKLLATYERGDYIKLTKKAGDWKSGTMLEVVDKTPDAIVVRDREGNEKTMHPREFGGAVSVGQVEQIEIAVGERVRFTAADRGQGIINGDRGEVTRTEDGQAFITLDRTGQEVSVPLDKDTPVALRYAYAQTGHSAQGATAKMFDAQGQKPNVILCTNAGDATVDAKSWYTNITRAADQVHLVTNATTARQIENVRAKITHSKEKDTAEALIYGNQQEVKTVERLAYIAPAAGDKAWQRIEVSKDATPAQMATALHTAHEQYGRSLFIYGTKDQQKTIAKVAGKEGMDIKLDDKALDAIRQMHFDKRMENDIAAKNTVHHGVGKLIAHGKDRYQFKPDEKQNYYAKVQTTGGKEHVVWGVDLERAIEASGAKLGDNVNLDFAGKTEVTITKDIKGADGRIIGTEEVTAHRNTWKVEAQVSPVTAAKEQVKPANEQAAPAAAPGEERKAVTIAPVVHNARTDIEELAAEHEQQKPVGSRNPIFEADKREWAQHAGTIIAANEKYVAIEEHGRTTIHNLEQLRIQTTGKAAGVHALAPGNAIAVIYKREGPGDRQPYATVDVTEKRKEHQRELSNNVER
jgi:conjugative relaxase-like TrwC/TraI family protein